MQEEETPSMWQRRKVIIIVSAEQQCFHLYNSIIRIYVRHCLLLDDDIFLFLHIIIMDGKLLTCALEHVQGLSDDAKQTEGEPAENIQYLSNS